MKPGWLPQKTWKTIQASVPVACVEVLPVRRRAGAAEVGLIWRETPHQGRRWCFIGGRLLKDEPYAAGVVRQMRETLGAKVAPPDSGAPLAVCEYFTVAKKNALFDPRQHAVSLLYAVTVRGTPKPQGEALDFAWFDAAGLPGAAKIGFGQRPMIVSCLRKLASGRR